MIRTPMVAMDLLKETSSSLSSNKVRSGLTMLGIIIGIASVITMVAIGQGEEVAALARLASCYGLEVTALVPAGDPLVGAAVALACRTSIARPAGVVVLGGWGTRSLREIIVYLVGRMILPLINDPN